MEKGIEDIQSQTPHLIPSISGLPEELDIFIDMYGKIITGKYQMECTFIT
jgi:hypothetical protein